MLISQWEWCHQLSAQIQKHPPEVFKKTLFLKTHNIHRKLPMLESFFIKIVFFVKKRLQTVFVGNIAKHLFE